MPQAPTSHRFEVLDSWRGICAVLVALLHLPVNSHLQDMAFFRNSYLFVDFFFVLSGFVIAMSYGQKLREGFGFTRFMLLRFGRIYPLHLVMLGAFIAFEGLQFMIPALGAMGGAPPFAAPRQSADTIFSSLLLVQSFGTYDFLTWNTPAWSIATEFWSYMAFAIITIVAGRAARPVMAVAALAGMAFLVAYSPHGMNTTFDYGMIRCLVGFFAGVLGHAAWKAYFSGAPTNRRQGNFVEVATLVSTGIFVSCAGQDTISIFAPLVFASVVVIFANESGFISAILRKPFFTMLGTLSFSIYMTHLFIGTQMMNAAKLGQSKLGMQLIVDGSHNGESVRLLGLTHWQGDLWALAIIVITIAGSAVSYRLVEVPAREWFRRIALRKQDGRNSAALAVRSPLTQPRHQAVRP